MLHSEKGYRSLEKQAAIIVTVIFLFMTAACINKKDCFDEHLIAFGITAVVDCALLIYWCWLAVSRIAQGFKWNNFDEKNTVKGIFLVFVYCFCTRVVQIWDTPRWDALAYYRLLMEACENFDFSLSSFLSGFSLAFHPTLAYAGLAGIGEFLWPETYRGVLYIQLILHLLMGFCVYKIFSKILPKNSWIYNTVATCIVLTTPLVLGTFSYFHPDAGTAYFFTFFLYCYLYKKRILMFFCMLLLIQTKEIGSVILAGFVIGMLIGRAIFRKKGKGVKESIFAFFKEPLGISCIAAALFLLAYFAVYLKNGGIIWRIGTDDGFSTIRITPSYLFYKWKQFFVLNFNWMIWGGNALLAIFLVKRKIRKKRIWNKPVVVGIAGAVFAQIAFYSTYITFTLPRYHILIDFGGTFLFMIFMGAFGRELSQKLLEIGWRRNLIFAFPLMIGLLLLIQAYTTIDPVSLAVFRNESTGNSRIIRSDYQGSLIQRDFCVYNHQYTYLNKAYDQVLKDVDYHEGMDVLIWNSNTNDEIFGDGYFWNSQKGQRTLKSGEEAISIRGIEREMIDKQEVFLNPEAVFILTPQFIISEEDAENYLNQYYEIRYKGDVDVAFGGKVTFYVCDLIKQVGME